MNPIISTIDLLKLASGDFLSLQVYRFIGANPGKKVYLQANLHGSEIVGNEVIHQLIQFLIALDSEQINGEICLVPVCNPLGTNQRNHFFSTGRFNSYDGKDWNRIFWDYEKEAEDLGFLAKSYLKLNPKEIEKRYFQEIKKAFIQQKEALATAKSAPYNKHYRYQLQSLCLDANYVIDIHSSSNQGIDYIYCFQTREESAKYFLLDRGILMTKYDGDAFDEAFMKPWLALERELAKLGKKIKFPRESWTLELGSGMSMNPESISKGVKGIKNYLVAKGIIELENYNLDSTKIKLVQKNKIARYYAPTGGMIRNRVSLGSNVSAGEKIYQILSFNKKGELPTVIDILAMQDGLVFDNSTNQTVNQGEYVLSIMNDE